MELKMWKVNAGRRSVLAPEFVERGIIAIGWRDAGDYTGARSRDEVLKRVVAAYPDRTDQQNLVAAAQIWRFLTELQVDDRVITYDPTGRLYHLGQIAGDAMFAPDVIEQLPVQRAVSWEYVVRRDELSTSALGKLGAILTLFKVDGAAAAELERLAAGAAPATSVEQVAQGAIEEAADPFEGLEDQALERIKDRLLGLDWSEMQELVAGLLRALGYRTIISPARPDRGKDIIASRDGFGFEPPRIIVEVKHRRGAMGAPGIRSFLGGRHAEDRGST